MAYSSAAADGGEARFRGWFLWGFLAAAVRVGAIPGATGGISAWSIRPAVECSVQAVRSQEVLSASVIRRSACNWRSNLSALCDWRIMLAAWARHFMARSGGAAGSCARRRQSFHCSEAATKAAAMSARRGGGAERGDAGDGGAVAAGEVFLALGEHRGEGEAEGADEVQEASAGSWGMRSAGVGAVWGMAGRMVDVSHDNCQGLWRVPALRGG